MNRCIWSVTFTQREQAELVEHIESSVDPEPGEVAGPTLFTLISPGTEVSGGYLGQQGQRFPKVPGYAAVFQVAQVGAGITGIQPGETRFCMGPHRSWQRVAAADTLSVPAGLLPEHATFARLMGVIMATLVTTAAAPPAWAMVTGLGPVGHLGAQIFRACGYSVLAVDPDARRQEFARQVGIEHVFAAVPVDDARFARQVALQIECSGHEQAVVDGCRLLAKGGEISLVGAPWARRSEAFAYELTERIFFDYLTVRSGWEWQLPRHVEPFRQHSTFGNFATAMAWLRAGRVQVDGLYSVEDPRAAQRVYQELLHRRAPALAQVFDWRPFKSQS